MRRLTNYFAQHRRLLALAVADMARAPAATVMTLLVIGITLALPTVLYVLVDNVARVSRGWDAGGQISLFMKSHVSDAAAERLAERLRRLPGVARTQFLSRAQALAEFKQASGMGQALDALERNPLPAVVIVYPARQQLDADGLQALLKQLQRREEVDLAQLDVAWVKRLHALLAIIERAVAVLAILLAVAVVLTIGNTIRLGVSTRRDEIEVMKLIGATNGYIRRPFLYTGLLQGLLGAGVAWGLTAAVIAILRRPIHELAGLYGSAFDLEGIAPWAGLALLAAGGLLGWLGSRIAVSRHLARIEPV